MGYFRRGLAGGFAADGSVIPNKPATPTNTGIVPPGVVVSPVAANASVFTPTNLLIGGAILAVGYFAAGRLLLRK